MNETIKGLTLAAVLTLPAAAAAAEARELQGFDRILFAVPGDLTLVQGDDFEVEIEADDADLERIETRVRGEELAIRWNEGLMGVLGGRPEGDIDVTVTLPMLERLELAGSGRVEGGSWLSEAFAVEVSGSGAARFAEIATEELVIEISGSGSVAVAEVDAAAARVEISGSGDVELAGAADEQQIEVMGSGDVDARDLEGARVEVDIMGGGDVVVWANESLSTEIMGSGDVRYRGSPRVARREFGSGRVRPL